MSRKTEHDPVLTAYGRITFRWQYASSVWNMQHHRAWLDREGATYTEPDHEWEMDYYDIRNLRDALTEILDEED